MIKKVKEKYLEVLQFFFKMDFKLTSLGSPIFFSFLSAVFEGMSLWLLIPAFDGIVNKNFTTFYKTKIFLFINNISNGYLERLQIPVHVMLIFLISITFLAVVMKNIFLYLSIITMAKHVRKFASNMRCIVFNRYLSFGKLFFDRIGIGHLNAVLLYFTEEVSIRINSLKNFFHNVICLFIYVIMMLTISWELTLFLSIFYPIFNIPMKYIIKKIEKSGNSFSLSKIKLSKKINDILSCIPLVKSYGMEKTEKSTFAGISKEVAAIEYSIDKKGGIISPIYEVGFTLLLLIGMGFVSLVYFKFKKGSIASLLVFFFILKKTLPLIQMIEIFKAEIAQSMGSIKNILEMLDDNNKFFVIGGKEEFPGIKEKIELRNLRFSYVKEREVLKGISLTIKKGEVTAIVGKTGGGKTTIAHLLMRFYDCPEGAIFLDRTDIKEYTIKSICDHMALVSQETFLLNDTIKNNILYGVQRAVSDEELCEIVKKARLYDFIEGLHEKYDTIIGDRGVKLSGGEKQRLSIARALAKKTEILILDEATSSLDTKTERLIQEAIDDASKNKTVIVIAHRLSTIKKANKIIVIENGKVTEEGNLSELIDKKGVFYQYWDEQKFF